jgi:Protein of unknown function (DUF3375)
MSILSTSASYLALREGRAWKLLAADLAPLVLAMLQSLFAEEDKTLPSSILYERLTRHLDTLRAAGHALPQSAQAYVADWLGQGWLGRRFPAGASEEEYEPTAEAANALRYVAGLSRPRSAATESRLASVMQQVVRLSEETDTNPKTRLAALQAERDRIDMQIASLGQDSVRVLPDERALERAREIIALSQELAGDFRNVRDAFDRLNRELRQDVMENEGSRGEVLSHLFDGMDLIGDSDAGRTFTAFWRLLTDGEQSAALADALDALTGRRFALRLEPRERKFLRNLTAVLMQEGGEVHEVLQQFARSLRSFVQSREFQEQRRLHVLLRQAQQAALTARARVRPNEALPYSLWLTSSRIRSASQWQLYDPLQRVPDAEMADAVASELNLADIEALVRQSEIDFRTLAQHVREMLSEVSQASVGELLRRFPAEQGFGSVIGYIALGARHGEVTTASEIVEWTGLDGVTRSAHVPTVYFLRERLLEFNA